MTDTARRKSKSKRRNDNVQTMKFINKTLNVCATILTEDGWFEIYNAKDGIPNIPSHYMMHGLNDRF